MKWPIIPFCLLLLSGVAKAMDSNDQESLSPAEQLQLKLNRYFQHVVNTPPDAVANQQIEQFWTNASLFPLHSKDICPNCINGRVSQECWQTALDTRYILSDKWMSFCEETGKVVPPEILNFGMQHIVKQYMAKLQKIAGTPENSQNLNNLGD
jgi:hypothetical protein